MERKFQKTPGLRRRPRRRRGATAPSGYRGATTTVDLEERLNRMLDVRWISELHALVGDVTPALAPPAPPTEFFRRPPLNGPAVIAIIASLTWWWGAGSVVEIEI